MLRIGQLVVLGLPVVLTPRSLLVAYGAESVNIGYATTLGAISFRQELPAANLHYCYSFY